MKSLSIIFAFMLVCLFFLAENSSNVFAQDTADVGEDFDLVDAGEDSGENADVDISGIIEEEMQNTEVERRSD